MSGAILVALAGSKRGPEIQFRLAAQRGLTSVHWVSSGAAGVKPARYDRMSFILSMNDLSFGFSSGTGKVFASSSISRR